MGKQPASWFKTDRRQFVTLLRDISGLDQESADQIFDGFLNGLYVWLLANVKNLPPNTGGRLRLRGVGRLDVTVVTRGRRNPRLLASGVVEPAPVTAKVEFHPSETIKVAIRKTNAELNHWKPSHKARSTELEPIQSSCGLSQPTQVRQ